MAGDFAPRGVGTTAVTTGPAIGPVATTPAVLTDGAATNVATVTPPRQSAIGDLPPLPKDDPAAASSKLSASDKARVIAELEALARGEVPAGTASATRPECAPAAAKPGVTAAALPASCTTAPKPAVRP